MAIGESHWFQQKFSYTIKPNSEFLKRNSQDCLSAFRSSPISFGLRWSPCPLVLRNYSLYSADVLLSEKERPTIQREKIPSNSPKKFQVRTLLMYVIQWQSKADPTPRILTDFYLVIHNMCGSRNLTILVESHPFLSLLQLIFT